MKKIQKYAQTDIFGKLSSYTPSQLTFMLLEGAIERIRLCHHFFIGNKTLEKAESIKNIILILNELESSLKHDVDPELCENLRYIYRWSVNQLIIAQYKNDVEILKKVEKVLFPLFSAWQTIVEQESSKNSYDS